jgi:hypothetical protein
MNINNPNTAEQGSSNNFELRLNNFKTIEAVGLEISGFRAPCMSLPSYQIS